MFKACYPNLTDVENPLEKNETDILVETESISQTSGDSTEASRKHFEDPPNNQDQDIVQEQMKNKLNQKMKQTSVNSTL